jgi:two-component system CheB/CheR fusion protein
MNEIEKGGKEPRDLVVVGSSAGGVEALSVLVGTLPKSFPAPIVLAQHLDPNHQSTLDLILQRRTTYPIQVVRDREPLEDGKIYVIPSNSMVTIKDHTVEIVPDTARRPRPSVDLLLSTAAEAYGEHLIAVILTGSGSDGAAGAVEVKNHGGVVIIQDPQTARYPAMPLALPPTAIDFEASLEQIGPLLYDLLTGATIPQGEERSEDVLHTIFEIVNRQANIDFRPYKASTILRRIGRRMTITHTRTLHDYAEYLRSFPEEVGELVKAFLINVTQFFRDADAFTYLRKEILPRLIARARERDKVLRFWAAGCATGEEPYSLAMILSDLLGTDLLEWSVKIFATDLDDAVISFARRGIYSDAMLKGIPTDYRDRFFERVDTGYRISKMLRQMVIFGQQDLSRCAPGKSSNASIASRMIFSRWRHTNYARR